MILNLCINGFLFFIILFAGVCYLMNKNYDNSSKVYRVSMLWAKKSINDIDPANISYANEAIVLDNLYGNLITYDNEGNLITDLADKFYWDGESYNFVFGNKKTSQGQQITAHDAELSLKRLLILSKNSHGKLTSYICGTREVKKIDDYCSGITVEDNILKIKATEEVSYDLILSLLTGVDFKIIPSSAIDKNYPYRIKDYANTTGPYYFVDDKKSKFKFSVNSYYSQSNKIEIRNWEIVARGLFESIDNIDHEIDIITTASYVDWSKDKNKKYDSVSIFSTLPISIELMVFTQYGMDAFTVSERAKIANLLKIYLKNKFDLTKMDTYQFFPKDGSGWLDWDKEVIVQGVRNNITDFNRKIKIGFPKSVFSKLTNLDELKKNNIEIVVSELHNINKDKDLVAEFVSTDSNFQEDISLLEYNFNFGIFTVSNTDTVNWMASYTRKNKIERLYMLKELQFELLSSIKIAPLYSMAYYLVIAGSDWEFNMSKSSASTHLWKIQKK